MTGKKSLSIQEEEILMEQLRNCLCLYSKSKISCNERGINRNAWSEVAEKLDFIQNVIYKCRYEQLSDCCASPVVKNRKVRVSLSAREILFLNRVSFFEMNGTTSKRHSDRSGDIPKYLKIRDE